MTEKQTTATDEERKDDAFGEAVVAAFEKRMRWLEKPGRQKEWEWILAYKAWLVDQGVQHVHSRSFDSVH